VPDRRGVTIRGLMLLPPAVEQSEDARPYFAALRSLRDDLVSRGVGRLSLPELSMGMSHDFEVAIEGRSWRLHRLDPLARRAGAEDDPARLVAPVHGRVLDVPVSPGSSVKRGQVLMLLECMKLEYRVTAPADGLVEALHYAVGDVVEEGALLLTFVPSAGSG